jgi:hypothetical protein
MNNTAKLPQEKWLILNDYGKKVPKYNIDIYIGLEGSPFTPPSSSKVWKWVAN